MAEHRPDGGGNADDTASSPFRERPLPMFVLAPFHWTSGTLGTSGTSSPVEAAPEPEDVPPAVGVASTWPPDDVASASAADDGMSWALRADGMSWAVPTGPPVTPSVVAPLASPPPTAELQPQVTHAPAGLRFVTGPAHGTADRSPSPPRAGAAPATLIAERINCWFGERLIIENVNLVMPAGQITGLIGPSGCGKSTFLRALNRLHELVPSASLSGSITLNGFDIYGPEAKPTEVRARIGMVFQRPNPFPAMTIAENVLAGLSLSGTRAAHREEIVESCLRRAGLWRETKDRLHTSGASLSGGQQQRLCIARSLAVRPEVLLLDEPCSALDPISTGLIEETLHEIKSEVTIVIVTHNMQQAARVCDDCALFLVDVENAPGRIVEAGPTEDMFSRPTDPRTADYIAGRFG